jgi:hypothetical protein
MSITFNTTITFTTEKLTTDKIELIQKTTGFRYHQVSSTSHLFTKDHKNCADPQVNTLVNLLIQSISLLPKDFKSTVIVL